MKKTKYGFEEFTFKDLEGKEFHISCFTKDTQSGFYHKAIIVENKIEAKVSWSGRTWESFKYESCLKKLACKLPKDLKEYVNLQIDAISKQNYEETEKWFNNFKSRYDALSEDTKKRLANSNVEITSKEQGEEILKFSEMYDAMIKAFE